MIYNIIVSFCRSFEASVRNCTKLFFIYKVPLFVNQSKLIQGIAIKNSLNFK